MTETILQAYLNEQHIKSHVKEDIDSLTKAVKTVKTHLTRKKGKEDTIPFTLVSLDPMVKDIDPVVQQVEETIIKKWPAFKNSVAATQDKSTTYVRAVILESLSQLAKEDAATAALIWLTARDVIGYYQLGSEESVISRFLQELADQTEENGQAAWGIIQKPQVSEFQGPEVSISGVKAAEIDGEALKAHLLDAMVHRGWNNHAGGGKNPQGQLNWQWQKFAAEHSAKGISEAVNSALSEQTQSLSSIPSSIKHGLDTYFAQLKPFFEELSTSFANNITANNKRSELLWWKQSLYSRLLNTSYRSLDPLNATVCMALDLGHEVVEAIYPESVDYLLRETLRDVHGEKAEEDRLLSDWLEEGSNLHEDIRSALKDYTTAEEGRKPLLSAWANVLHSGEPVDFSTETGINKKARLTVSDLAVWLFHGLQAHKLATAK